MGENSSDTQASIKDYSDIWKLDSGDKYVDVACGRHFTLVCTEKGKVYGTGYLYYRKIAKARFNKEDNEDKPYEIKLPTGYKALKVFCSERYYVAYVLAEKDGKRVVLSGGEDYEMLGQGESDDSPDFKPVKLPDDVTITKLVT